jgi:hypothetical protein
MEITQGISLYSYPHLKLEKRHIFLIIVYVFSSTKLENKRVEQICPAVEVRGKGTQIIYSHVSKCKNN